MSTVTYLVSFYSNKRVMDWASYNSTHHNSNIPLNSTDFSGTVKSQPLMVPQRCLYRL